MEGVQGLCLGGIRAGLRLGSPVRQSCTAVCVSPASSSVAAPGLVGAIDQHSSRMTSGLFLKEALSRTEALPGATLRGGPGSPSPVQRRGPRRRCPQPTPAAWETGRPSRRAFGQPRVALATRGTSGFRVQSTCPVCLADG